MSRRNDRAYDASDGRDCADLGSYVRLLRRHVLVLGLCAVLGVLAGWFYTHAQPKQFKATSAVLVRPIAVNSDVRDAVAPPSVNMDAEAQVLESDTVAALAKQLMRTPISIDSLVERVGVFVPPDTTVLRISYVGPSRLAAQLGAQSFAQAYLTKRGEQARAVVSQQQAGLAARLAMLQAVTEQNAIAIAAAPRNSPDRAFAQAQQNVVLAQLSSVQSLLTEVTSASHSPGQIVVGAQPPPRATSPVRRADVGAGLMLGLLIGVAIAVARDASGHPPRGRRLGSIRFSPAYGKTSP